MNFIESLPFNKNVLYSDAYSYNGESQKIYFQILNIFEGHFYFDKCELHA